jgi:N-terminal domain of toast_rack, DUF2154
MKNSMLVCLLTSLLFVGCDAVEGPADIQVLRESRPIGSTQDLAVDLKYDVGQLEVMRTSDDSLFNLDLQYDRRRYEPRFTFNEGERASIRLDVESNRGFGSPHGRDNDLTLRLSDKVALDLNLTAGVTESRLEMAGLKIRRLHLRGGVGKTEVTFDKPTGQVLNSLDVESGVGELIIHGLGNAQVEQVDLKGGVGHTELDFTGELGTANMQARIKVGVGAVRLTIPREADVEIEAEGSFLSHISAPSFDRDGRKYTHHGDGGAKIRIEVQSGVGGVEVELI